MGRAWIFRETLPFSGTHQEQALPILRNAKIHGVKDLIVLSDLISLRFKIGDDLLKKLPVLTYRESTDVLEHEELWLQFRDNPYEMVDEVIARIFKSTLADHTEPLAGSATKNYVYIPLADLRIRSYIFARDVGDAAANRGASWKVVFMRGGVYGIVLDRGRYLESCLFEPQR